MNNDFDDLVRAQREEVHKPPAHLKQQWHAAIDEAAALERGRQQEPRRRWSPGLGFLGVAVTAALALGVGIGVFLNEEPTEAAVPAITQVASSDAFSRGLQYHLRDARTQLVSLDGGSDTTMLALEIVAQNRLYMRAAEQNNAPGLARVLRAFEPILMELAADDVAPDDAEALRAQLAFELNVMLTKLARDASDKTHTT